MFWLKQYHIDGLRVDAVASMLYLDYSRKEGEWIPNIYGGNENLEAISFLRRFNELAHSVPGAVTIAEESTAFSGVSRPVYMNGLGFTMKWNMGWMHDMLHYFAEDPVYRKYHHNNITFSMLYAFTENFVLPISHDEVVYGKRSLLNKMPGDEWQRFANVRAFLAYMYGHPGKKLLFMGSEIGQSDEWNHGASVNWELLNFEPHRKLQSLVRELNRFYAAEPALCEVDFNFNGFEWIDFRDVESSVILFARYSEQRKEHLVFACNFTPVPRPGYRIGVPQAGFYKEVFNTDSEMFGGSNVCNGLDPDRHPAGEVPQPQPEHPDHPSAARRGCFQALHAARGNFRRLALREAGPAVVEHRRIHRFQAVEQAGHLVRPVNQEAGPDLRQAVGHHLCIRQRAGIGVGGQHDALSAAGRALDRVAGDHRAAGTAACRGATHRDPLEPVAPCRQHQRVAGDEVVVRMRKRRRRVQVDQGIGRHRAEMGDQVARHSAS